MAYVYHDGLDDPLLFERVEHLAGGMNGFARSSLLPPEVCQYMQDIEITDNGLARTRPGIVAKGTLTGTGVINGLAYLDTPLAEQLIAAKAGKWYSGEGSPFAWTERATGMQDGFTAMAQGGNFMYISDGTNQWYRWSGSALSAALGSATGGSGDPPVGALLMAWHTHRMFAAAVSSEPDTVWASDIGDAGTGHWDHVNFKFRVGWGEGEIIKSIMPMQDFWLAVLKTNSVYLVNTDPTQATAANWPIQRVTSGIGCVGKRAACLHGNDVLFMAKDGVRSLRRMAGASGQFELSAPISQPLQPYIDRINWTYADKISATSYRQYALFSVPLDSSTTPNYVLVWNGRLGVWVGVWTNLKAMCFTQSEFSAPLRLNIGDSAGQVQEWMDYADRTADATYQDNTSDVLAKIKLRGMIFGEPVSKKDGNYLEVRFENTNGAVKITLLYEGTEITSWTEAISTGAITLPVTLPFTLPTVKPITVRKALDNYGEFYEATLQIESLVKRMSVKTATMAAFLNTIENE